MPTPVFEITDSARQLIRDAWRRGQVLVVTAPWQGYRWTGALVTRWRRVGDDKALANCTRVGEGEWVYLQSDLLPVLRHRRVRLEPHSILGFWAGVAARDLDPVAVVPDDGWLWRRDGGER